jgi:hypothetical protein
MLEETPSQAEAIERNKEKTNLRLALAFVEKHLNQYQANVDRFLSGEEFPASRAFAEQIAFDFEKANQSVPLQITPDEIKTLIAHVSPGLIRYSELKTVNFTHHNKVALPDFGEDGNLSAKRCRGAVPADEFVREPENYHPHRILIGLTTQDGKTIFPMAIPSTVSNDPEAIRIYQLHVMLHEFFHTIENTRRDDEKASAMVINPSNGRTFADWSKDYLASLADEKLLTSEYSQVYTSELFDEQGAILPAVTPYGDPVREDMAEAWVASHFDIISNPHGYTSFSSFPFGNARSQDQLLAHGVASKRAALMKELRMMQ